MDKALLRAIFLIAIGSSVVGCTSPSVAITDRILDSRDARADAQAYNQYLNDAARVNLEREKAGLAPAPIMSREQWSGGR